MIVLIYFNIIIQIIDNNGSDGSSEGWINWFCEVEGHEFFVEVDHSYISDSFNLCGLKEIIGENFDKALEMILSMEIPEEEDLTKPK